MPSSGSVQVDVFDLRKIRRLVHLMHEHDLAEIELKQGNQGIRLCRSVPPPVVSAVSPVAAGTPASVSSVQELERSSQTDTDFTVIRSPMVGTFYSAASPDAEAFVNIGDSITPSSIVCVVEAMKVFNEIQAECSGKITAVLVENGDPVEFGQPMFKVDTTD